MYELQVFSVFWRPAKKNGNIFLYKTSFIGPLQRTVEAIFKNLSDICGPLRNKIGFRNLCTIIGETNEEITVRRN